MGTSNFANVSTSKIFAVDGEGQYDFVRERVSEDLNELSSKEGSQYMYYDTDEASVEGRYDRSYSSTSIGVLYTHIEFPDLNEDITISVTPKTTAGYYSGFTLDFDIEFENLDEIHEAADEMVDDLLENPEDFMSDTLEKLYVGAEDDDEMVAIKEKFMSKFDSDAIKKKLQEELDKMTDKLEELYEELSTPLMVVARASNGEVMYERA